MSLVALTALLTLEEGVGQFLLWQQKCGLKPSMISLQVQNSPDYFIFPCPPYTNLSASSFFWEYDREINDILSVYFKVPFCCRTEATYEWNKHCEFWHILLLTQSIFSTGLVPDEIFSFSGIGPSRMGSLKAADELWGLTSSRCGSAVTLAPGMCGERAFRIFCGCCCRPSNTC